VIIAPVGRDNIPEAERLDVARIIGELQGQGLWARNPENVDAILEELVREARPGDTIALLSNGAFGGIHGRLIEALS